jgi:hypothetical protein
LVHWHFGVGFNKKKIGKIFGDFQLSFQSEQTKGMAKGNISIITDNSYLLGEMQQHIEDCKQLFDCQNDL